MQSEELVYGRPFVHKIFGLWVEDFLEHLNAYPSYLENAGKRRGYKVPFEDILAVCEMFHRQAVREGYRPELIQRLIDELKNLSKFLHYIDPQALAEKFVNQISQESSMDVSCFSGSA